MFFINNSVYLYLAVGRFDQPKSHKSSSLDPWRALNIILRPTRMSTALESPSPILLRSAHRLWVLTKACPSRSPSASSQQPLSSAYLSRLLTLPRVSRPLPDIFHLSPRVHSVYLSTY